MRLSHTLLPILLLTSAYGGCVAFNAVPTSSVSVHQLSVSPWSSSSSSLRYSRRRQRTWIALSATIPEVGSTDTTTTTIGIPGTADLPWSELGFEYRTTKSHLRMVYHSGSWHTPEMIESPYLNIHIGATALHYGQACFEGLKAFAHADGTVHLHRPDENAKRINCSAARIMMPQIPLDMFIKACNDVVKDNIAYVPPYGSGGALYLRPLLFGSGPRIGLQPAEEYTFLIMVVPVGDYYKGGLAKPVSGLIVEDYDRAAPRGVGAAKVAGNYAADLIPNMEAKKSGYPICLYLDAATHTKVEEFSTSNFIGIDNANKRFITPKSPSVLPSVTNKSLQTIAKDVGMTIEARDIMVDELETFDEVIACGTAVVVTPIGSLTRLNSDEAGGGGGKAKTYQFTQDVGETTRILYDRVRSIQNGEAEDVHKWNFKVQ